MDELIVCINNKNFCYIKVDEDTRNILNDDDSLSSYVSTLAQQGRLERFGISPTTEIFQIDRITFPEEESTVEDIASEPVAGPSGLAGGPSSFVGGPLQESGLWTSKKATIRDQEATGVLLELRGNPQYKKLFEDKKTTKGILWQKIACDMISRGFNFGCPLKAAGERCRKRFSNLQRGYTHFITHSKQTGSERIKVPPYFNELHFILGEKHKIFPTYLKDSLDDDDDDSLMEQNIQAGQETHPEETTAMPTSEQQLTPEDLTVPTDDINTSIPTSHRFSTIQTRVRPQKQTVTQTLKQMHEETLTVIKQQFESMRQQQETETRQRDRLIELFEEMVHLQRQKQERQRKRKRRRESSSSSD